MKRFLKIILFGVALIVIGMICVANTILGMIRTFDNIAAHSGTASPEMLAEGIGKSLISTYIAISFGFAGLYFLIWGLKIYFTEKKKNNQEGQVVQVVSHDA
jgi:hypothetical protein